MAQLDFDTLIQPYAKDEDTLAALRAGLVKDYPEDTVENAFDVTFARMARGKVFDDLRGLARYLRKECVKQIHARERAALRVHQTNLNQILRTVQPLKWWTLVPVGIGSFACGMATAWLLII